MAFVGGLPVVTGTARMGQRITPMAKTAPSVPRPTLAMPSERRQALASQLLPQTRARSVAAQAEAAVAKLPWQVSMSEIKKRRDLHTIMIIGAGPIVIGQVCSLAAAPMTLFGAFCLDHVT